MTPSPKHDLIPEYRTSRVPYRSLGARIFSSHLLAILAAIALVSFALLSLFRGYFLDALEDSLILQSDLIARSILPEVDPLVEQAPLPPAYNTVQQQQANQLSIQIQNQSSNVEPGTIEDNLKTLEQSNIAVIASLQTDVYLFDRDLQVLLAPADNAAQPGIYSTLVEAALVGRSVRKIITIDQGSSLAVASPLRHGDETLAVIVLSHPLSDLEAVFQNLWLRLAFSGLISLLVASVISLLFTRSIQHPVYQLRAASEHLRQGDYDYPLAIARGDELGDLARTFDMMRKQLKSTEQLRTRFLSDVAHELRTPLTSIKGLIETLLDGAVDDPRVRHRFLGSIERETDRLIRLTHDLLTLTRAEVAGFSLEKEAVDLHSLVEEIFLQFNVEARQKSIRLELQDETKGSTYWLDGDRIGQVLINLIDNALRHSPENGTLSVHIGIKSASELPQKCHTGWRGSSSLDPVAQSWLLVTISDQGVGIPEKDLERIFDRFYRVEPSRDRLRGGSGLGLPIAKAIIDAHGGCIWAENTRQAPSGDDPRGSELRFCIPLAQPDSDP